jgi:phage tail-like protein
MNKQSILLNKYAGWETLLLDHLELADGGDSLRLRLLPGAARPLTDSTGTLGGFTNPIGMALDTQNSIYILDSADNLIRRFDPCLQTFQILPYIGGAGDKPRQFNEPMGIAICGRDDLFVADSGNWRVQVFTVKGLALRRILGPYVVQRIAGKIEISMAIWTRAIPGIGTSCDPSATAPAGLWKPADVAVSCSGWLYVADYNNGLIHVFDPHLCWRKAYNGSSTSSPALQKPVRIALDKQCRIYVIQESADHVVVLGSDGSFLGNISAPEDVKGKFCPVTVAVDDQGNLHVADPYTLYQFQPTGVNSFCCVSQSTQPAVTGIADLVFDTQGNPIVAAGSQVTQMTAKLIYEPQGTFVSDALDSRIYRCPWHRVVLHGMVATGTQISVETLTAEETKTAAEVLSLPDSRWTPSAINSTVATGDWDCLVQSPRGRYLWLRLKFFSDGVASPCVDHVRIHYPRASSLQYLPALYSQDEPSRQFLDQFLSIFDTMWGTVGNKLTRIAAYFDPMATPGTAKNPGDTDFLTWLASWVGMSLDRNWPEERRRKLLKNAWKLYKLRGTPAGLKLHIELYTGIEPQILEHFKLRRWLYAGSARLGDQSALWGADIVDRLELDVHAQLNAVQLIDTGDPLTDPFSKEAHQFTVFVPQRGSGPVDPQADALQQQTVQRIIEMAKPAHTLGYLQMTRPRFRIGIQSFIGKDTVVGKYPNKVIEGQSKLGYDSTLGEPLGEQPPPGMRVGKSTRIAATTLIN